MIGFIFTIFQLFAEPKYIVRSLNFPDDCQQNCTSSNVGQYFAQLEKVDDRWKVTSLVAGNEWVKISNQESFTKAEGVPFFQVSFQDGALPTGLKVYALRYSTGTAGANFYYFIEGANGEVKSSGPFPEIIYDQDTKRFVSYERDGADIHVMNYLIKKNKFEEI